MKLEVMFLKQWVSSGRLVKLVATEMVFLFLSAVKQIGNKSNLSFPSRTAMANWVLSTNSGDE